MSASTVECRRGQPNASRMPIGQDGDSNQARPWPVPAMTVSTAIEVETSVRNLPCQTAGTGIGRRTTRGDVPVVGGACKLWSFMLGVSALRVPGQAGPCSLSCGSRVPLCLLPLGGRPIVAAQGLYPQRDTLSSTRMRSVLRAGAGVAVLCGRIRSRREVVSDWRFGNAL